MKSAFKSEKGREKIRGAVRSLYAQDPAETESRFLDTGEFGETHVLSAGPEDAPPLVLLHGTSSNSLTWLGYVPSWAKAFRIHALDFPGQPGLSADRRPPLAGGAYNRWLEASVDALGLESFSLAGRSMGGLVALGFAMENPKRVEKLVLLSPGGLAPPRMSFFFRILPLVFLGNPGVRRINRIVAGNAPMDPRYEAFSLLATRHFVPVTDRIPVFSDEELGRVECPVLYIGGENDVMLRTRESALRLEKLIPGAEAIVLEEVGHVVTGKGREIEEFLSR